MSDIRTVKLRERGQFTLPAEFIKRLNLQPGDKLDLDLRDGLVILTPSRMGIIKAVDAIHAAFVASGVSEEEFQEELRKVREELSPDQSARRKSA